MLDLKILQKDIQKVKEALIARNSNIDLAEFEALDEKRRALLSEVESLKSTRNKASAEVARMKREKLDAEEYIAQLGDLSNKIKELDVVTEEVKAKQEAFMLNLPNIPDSSVPLGKDEHDNLEVHRHGNIPSFNFEVKDHHDLGSNLKGLDFERGAKLAGARFSVLYGWAARLERALINFFLDAHTLEWGRTEINVPFMVNSKSMQGTGQLPKFAEDLFKIENWDEYLIPTSEVPLTNLHADEVLDEASLPVLYTSASPCFRSEAGAYGKDTRGLIRQHQFTKVEMVSFSHPEKSFEALESMRRSAEILLERLELPYRTVVLCSGDMGFSAVKTYDIEVWLPAQNTYREISSCSNCGDFQARRANIRFRPNGGGKPEFVHTLNGSGLPVGRTLVAIIENYQQEDGSIKVPTALIPYMNGVEYIK